MYAAAYPLTTRPSISLLPVPATTTKRLHTIVSAQLRPTSKDDDEFNQQNVGSIGHAVLTASSNQIHRTTTTSKEPQPQQLSGSDVLWALRKATAEKAKKKAKKGIQTGSSITGGGKVVREGRIKSVPDVQPVRVEEEWGLRLEQLQNRLDELKIEPI